MNYLLKNLLGLITIFFVFLMALPAHAANNNAHINLYANRNLKNVAQIILPRLVRDEGYDEFDVDFKEIDRGKVNNDIMLAMFCHNKKSVYKMNIKNNEIDMPIDADSIKFKVLGDGMISATVDVPDFYMTGTFQFLWPKISSAYCNTFGTNINKVKNFVISDLRATITVKIEKEPGENQLHVKSIEELKINLGDVDLANFWDNLFAEIAISYMDALNFIFKDFDCRDLDECVTQQINKSLKKDKKLRKKIRNAIDDVLADAVSIEGGVDHGRFGMDYKFNFDRFSLDPDLRSIKTVWKTIFNRRHDIDPCARNMLESKYPAQDYEPTGGDFEMFVPFKVVSGLAFKLGKQGAFCHNFTHRDPDFGPTDFTLRPDGKFKIYHENTILSDFPKPGAKLNAMGINIKLIDKSPKDYIVLDVPVTVTGKNNNNNGNYMNLKTDFTGNLRIYTRPKVTCGDTVVLRVAKVDLINLTGSATAQTSSGQTVNLDASKFVARYKMLAESRIKKRLPLPITLVNQVLNLKGYFSYLKLKKPHYSDKSVTLALKLASGTNPKCKQPDDDPKDEPKKHSCIPLVKKGPYYTCHKAPTDYDIELTGVDPHDPPDEI